MFDFFKKVVTFHPIQRILAVQQWNVSEYGGQFGLAFITFLYVDILDCTGTLYSMARFCGVTDDRDGDFPRSTIAYCTDAACISIGSLLGCSPVTAFIESGAGIAEGQAGHPAAIPSPATTHPRSRFMAGVLDCGVLSAPRGASL